MPNLPDSPKTPEAKDLVHVVLAVYDPKGNYSRHAGVVVTSIFEHTKNPVRVHILHDDTLTDDNRRRFLKTAEKFGQEVRFIDATEAFLEMNRNGGMDELSREFTRGALFRLLIPDSIDAEKVIYMDCDVVVNMDISELWNVPLRSSGRSLAAVVETFERGIFERMRARVLNFKWDKFFNSGVLLMDLERIRQKHDLVKEAKAFFERFPSLCKTPDQEFLNAAFKEDALPIEERFNRLKDPYNIRASILHFIGVKPWQFLRDSPGDKFYWETFIHSEWNDQILDALGDLCGDRYMHRHSSDCIEHLVKRFWEKFWHTLRVSLPMRLTICRMAVSGLGRGVLKSENQKPEDASH
jgi:lipopolysaccharide biosynthesis glycosyltransferase